MWVITWDFSTASIGSRHHCRSTQRSSPMTTTPPAAAVPPPPSQNYAFASYMMQPPPTSDQAALPPQVQHSLAPNQPQQKINTMFDPSLAFQQTLTPTPLPMVSLDVSNPPANVSTTTIDPMTPFQIGAIPYPMPLSAGPQQPIVPPNGYAL
ncbi:hypothetical protein DM01DRAFT_1037965 [Hesseltinella vesiculosa]|uniref:Uncharacterized protein n=1 Tax=Hesseltinella vesiculosa TaxID=101127 RepID=A0A1X2GIM0_9FUNG|nr:hypothetical protein DM01DRAFT_1037965 [Hesseltinella vesiculosa]